MKTVASVFSWLGGIITIIVEFIVVGRGTDIVTTGYTYTYYGYQPYTSTQHVSSPAWLWILIVIIAIFQLIILIWRQSATSNGKKIGCGVCTLLFCSLVGGILTLCIPEDQLY